MSMHVCNGAMLKCMFAVPPGISTLIVLPINRVMTSNQPAANIMDNKPIVNIPTFGMCMSPTNPAFVSATAAALGVPTPVPCVPATPAPWITGAPTVMLGNMPALNNTSVLACVLGAPGCITITMPGQFTEQIP
ncbi:MAG: DUF4280 domain-containing protein [Candidatus Competibacteraceae bacterium]|nr:DUF4280 domain-containing protein [Candidatus Competibacteraceae bacterium]MCB1919258.1 DUF4280 domain-containing protein [Candidatus Competibacteraceae bacterium]MCP5125488.1 DUF4280 domain-containing protein [Gammaproteobacteria bacterium]